MDNFSSGGALRAPVISKIGRGEVEVWHEHAQCS